MFTEEQRADVKELLEAEMRQREQEVVCWMRVEAVNTGNVPRYAWFKAPSLAPFRRGSAPEWPKQGAFENGFTRWEETGTVASVNRLDGEMLPEEEMAVLIQILVESSRR